MAAIPTGEASKEAKSFPPVPPNNHHSDSRFSRRLGGGVLWWHAVLPRDIVGRMPSGTAFLFVPKQKELARRASYYLV